MKLLIVPSLSALALSLSLQSAFAQTPADTSTASTKPGWTDETIVVTGVRDGYAVPSTSSAMRTDTPLIETPQSDQVLNRTLLQEQDRRTLADALVNVSDVTPTKPEEVLFTPPIVRSFPAEVYLDGLALFGGPTQAADPTSLVGVERIVVLRVVSIIS